MESLSPWIFSFKGTSIWKASRSLCRSAAQWVLDTLLLITSSTVHGSDHANSIPAQHILSSAMLAAHSIGDAVKIARTAPGEQLKKICHDTDATSLVSGLRSKAGYYYKVQPVLYRHHLWFQHELRAGLRWTRKDTYSQSGSSRHNCPRLTDSDVRDTDIYNVGVSQPASWQWPMYFRD